MADAARSPNFRMTCTPNWQVLYPDKVKNVPAEHRRTVLLVKEYMRREGKALYPEVTKFTNWTFMRGGSQQPVHYDSLTVKQLIAVFFSMGPPTLVQVHSRRQELPDMAAAVAELRVREGATWQPIAGVNEASALPCNATQRAQHCGHPIEKFAIASAGAGHAGRRAVPQPSAAERDGG